MTGVRLHDLRHTGATLAAATGASTKELMNRLGHASSEAALRYQHATFDRDAVIAQALSELAGRSPESEGTGIDTHRGRGRSRVSRRVREDTERSGVPHRPLTDRTVTMITMELAGHLWPAWLPLRFLDR